jgi:HTH-type transcriptional regulator / antitoxin HipB
MEKDIIVEHIKTVAELGIALKRLRKNSNLTQEQLAKKLSMRQATISDLENGRGTLESFLKIIQALKINLALSNVSRTKNQDARSKVRKVLNLLND